MEKLNMITTVLFGLLGLTALLCALLTPAHWHFVTAAFCGLLVWASIAEIKINRRK